MPEARSLRAPFDEQVSGSTFAASPSWASILVSACLLVGVGTARAAWQAGGTPLDTQAGEHAGPRVVPDGLGGAYVVWTLAHSHVRAQHLTSAGDPAAGWGVGGQEIVLSGSEHFLLGAGSDGGNGLIAGVNEYGPGRAVRLLPDGSAAPGWDAAGKIFFTPSHETGRTSQLDFFTPDFAGGAWFGTDSLVTSCAEPGFCNYFGFARVDHVSSTGALDGRWNVTGGAYGASFYGPSARAGSIISAGISGEGSQTSWARFSPTPQLEWLGYLGFDHVIADGSADDGAGGALIVAEGNNYSTPPHLMRLDANGAVAVGWPADGVMLPIPSGNYLDKSAVDDGLDGILIGWRQAVASGFELRVVRMTNAGVPAAGWPAEGVLLNGAAGAHYGLRLAADGSGGVFAAWVDQRTDVAGDIYASHVNPDGTVDPAYAVNGSIIEAGPGAQGSIDIATVSADHAIVTWTDRRDGVHSVVYAQQLPPAFTLDVPKHAASGFTLVGFTPNPARGAIRVGFRLAEQADATLEVFDLLGRRMAGQELSALPAGDHSVPIDGAGSLPNGLYLIRVRVGDLERTARGLIAR